MGARSNGPRSLFGRTLCVGGAAACGLGAITSVQLAVLRSNIAKVRDRSQMRLVARRELQLWEARFASSCSTAPSPQSSSAAYARISTSLNSHAVARRVDCTLDGRMDCRRRGYERRQVALDLHDEFGPYLFGLKANTASIASGISGATLEDRAREMLTMIEGLQAINRRILNRLRPMALGQVPLTELLSGLVGERAQQHCRTRS